MRQAGGSSSYPPRSGYDELDTTLMPPRPGEHFAPPPPGGGEPGGPGVPPAGKEERKEGTVYMLNGYKKKVSWQSQSGYQ
jgi:hypothetical protein